MCTAERQQPRKARRRNQANPKAQAPAGGTEISRQRMNDHPPAGSFPSARGAPSASRTILRDAAQVSPVRKQALGNRHLPKNSAIPTGATRLFPAHAFCAPGRVAEGPWQSCSATEVGGTQLTNHVCTCSFSVIPAQGGHRRRTEEVEASRPACCSLAGASDCSCP